MMKKSVAIIVGVLLVALGAAGGALAQSQQVLVHLFDSTTTEVPIEPNAQIQVIRLAPEDAPYTMLVVTTQPGASTSLFRFYKMSMSVTPAPVPVCATNSPVPGWICVAGGNWVPPGHPLAQNQR